MMRDPTGKIWIEHAQYDKCIVMQAASVQSDLQIQVVWVATYPMTVTERSWSALPIGMIAMSRFHGFQSLTSASFVAVLFV
jgi:hypothetical protein